MKQPSNRRARTTQNEVKMFEEQLQCQTPNHPRDESTA